jgi:hypothetical protein
MRARAHLHRSLEQRASRRIPRKRNLQTPEEELAENGTAAACASDTRIQLSRHQDNGMQDLQASGAQ